MNLITSVLGALFGGSGVGSAIANVGKAAGIAITLPLAWEWFQGHQNDVVVTLNVAQAIAVVGLVYALLEIAHRARGPGQ